MEVPLDGATLRRILLALPASRRLSLLDSCGATTTTVGIAAAAAGSARYLIAGFDPFEVIELRGDEMLFERRGHQLEIVRTSANAFSILAHRLACYAVAATNSSRASASILNSGACIATLAYDLVHSIERLRVKSTVKRNEPDAVFAFYDTLVVHDYVQGKTEVVGRGRTDEVAATLLSAQTALSVVPDANTYLHAALTTSNFSRDAYAAAVQQIKEHIFAGDIYQANLTQQFTCNLHEKTKPSEIFERLRRDHPAPFAAYIVRREDTVVSASPERFLRVRVADNEQQKRMIEAWPIKGTRRRGRDAGEDAILRAELLASEKDRAENVMIVDLLRNDLGRVSAYGSVEVTELCALEEHPSLFHLVSRISARLRADADVDDILRATFPCGSITGAPKIRAMEIIHQIENKLRGLSMGAIGYFAFDGSVDLSVAIRTMVIRGQVARFNVGGGIVAESDPQLEYEESLLKAGALLRALGAFFAPS